MELVLLCEAGINMISFARRNSDVLDPPRLSDEWEAAIEKKWKKMSVENRNVL